VPSVVLFLQGAGDIAYKVGGPKLSPAVMKTETGLKVLLVEDSALTAEQLRELIHVSPCAVEVTTVASEQDAVAQILASVPDIVILDLKLRQGTGFRVLQRIASVEPKPCLVVLTNYALPKYKELALSAGADYFFDKAQDFKMLPGVIETVASQRALNQSCR
jgi:DNA-binding NarL/FixJ family response regulator